MKFRVAKAEVDIGADGVVAGDEPRPGRRSRSRALARLPDVVGELCRRVPLSRATIVRILKTIDNLDQVKVNPSVFIDRVGDAINQALYDQVADGIVYSPERRERWAPSCSRSATRTRRSPSPSSSSR